MINELMKWPLPPFMYVFGYVIRFRCGLCFVIFFLFRLFVPPILFDSITVINACFVVVSFMKADRIWQLSCLSYTLAPYL